jgi:RTX calcium-binding nonapeptide repeat (4 copies)
MGHLDRFDRFGQGRNSSGEAIRGSRRFDRRLRGRSLRPFVNGAEALEDRTLLSFPGLISTLDGDLVTAQGLLNKALDTATSIPFVGPELGTLPQAQFITGLRSTLDTVIKNLGGAPDHIQTALWTALGPAGLNVIADHNGNGIGPDDVVVTNPRSDGVGGFDVAIHLHTPATKALSPLAFNTGLSGLPFRVDVATTGGVDLTFGYDYELAFHYDANNGGSIGLDPGARFSDITPGAPNQALVIALGASLTSDFAATGTIGFVQGTLKPVPGQVNALTGQANTLAATFSMDRLDDLSSTVLTGQADVSLELGAGLGTTAAFPTVTTDFQLAWTLNSRDGADLPEVSFSDVKLDLGSFLSSILGPIVQDLSQIVGPGTTAGEIIAAIQTPIPGLSDLSELLGDGPVTIENLAVIAAGDAGIGPLASFIAQFVNITAEIAALKTSGDGSNVFINLGGFNLDGENLQGGPMGSLDNPSSGDLSDLTANPVGTLASLGSIESSTLVPQPVKDAISSFIPPANGAGIDIHFPILEDPAAAGFGLLLGRDASLVTVHADAHFHAKNNASTNGLSFYGVDLGFVGQVNFDADLTFGYDTYGLREILAGKGTSTGAILSDLGDGFYMTSGENGSYIKVSGHFGIKAGVNAIIASADVEGAIETGPNGNDPIDLSLNDDDKSGKVRLSNFTDRLIYHGSLDAGLSLRVAVGVDVPFVGFVGYQHTFGIASVTLLDFNSDSTKPVLALASAPDSNGVVTLYVGTSEVEHRVAVMPGGDAVVPNSSNSFGEYYTISDAGPSKLDAPGEESINVTFTVPQPNGAPPISVTQKLDHVREIDCESSDTGDPTYIDQGGPDGVNPGPPIFGDQALTIEVLEGVTSPVNLYGGSGKANLSYAGSATANLHAGQGDSVLVGGSGSNRLEGYGGTNTLVGGSSGATYIAGPGKNNIVVQGGLNVIDVKTDHGHPHPVDRLEVVAQPGTLDEKPGVLGLIPAVIGVFTPRNDPTAFAVQVTMPDGSIPVRITEHGISDLVIDGVSGNLPTDLVIGDLSHTGLRSLTAAVAPDDYIGTHNSVTIDGSAGNDFFSEATNTDTAGVTFTEVALLQGIAPGPTFSDMRIIGLRIGGSQLTLDGKGGSNLYTLNPDPGDRYTTSVEDTGVNPSDSVTVLAESYPEGAVGVSDAGVALGYSGLDGYYHYAGIEHLNLDGTVKRLNLYTSPVFTDTITASRNIGSTTIQSGGPVTTFNVSGLSTYNLIAPGAYDHFYVTLPPASDVAATSETTITGSTSSDTDTLEVIDTANPTSLAATYVVSRSGVKRTAENILSGHTYRAVATVTFNAMLVVTYDTGALNNTIDVESIEGATTVNSGVGINRFQITPTARDLDLIAGPLTLNTKSGSYDSLEIFDRYNARRNNFIQVSSGNVFRASVDPTGLGVFGDYIHSASINFNRLDSISITAPRANLLDTTSPLSDVYFATATLDAVPGDAFRSRIEDFEQPAIDFNDDLASLTITEAAITATLVVDQTPAAPCATLVQLSANGIATINATSGPLNLLGKAGSTGTVNVGQGSLLLIEGNVTVQDANNGSLVTLNIDDSNDRKAHKDVTIDSNTITGLAGVEEKTVIGYPGALYALNISGPLGTGFRRDVPPRGKPRVNPVPRRGSTYNIIGAPNSQVDPVTTLTSNGVDTVNVMIPNRDVGGYGALVIVSPKRSTYLNIEETAYGGLSDGGGNGGGQVLGNGGRTIESRLNPVAARKLLTASAGRGLAGSASAAAKKAAKAAASRNRPLEILRTPPPPPPPPAIIDSNQVSGVTPMDIDFTSDQLTGLTVSPGNHRVEVRGTPNHGAVGSVVTSLINLSVATVTVGDGSGRLSRVQGALDITKPAGPIRSLIVDGSTETAKQSATIAPGIISGLAPAKITYPALDLEVMHLLGGSGGNTFHVRGTVPRSPVMIDGGSGANKLIGPNLKEIWNITGSDAGNFGIVTFKRFGSLDGGGKADTFLPVDGATLSGTIDGGLGRNTLDMSAQNRDVVVNLALRTATAVGGSVAHISNAKGSMRNSILVGDASANKLEGGVGNNLVIGGGGLDQVLGGSGDNILIGGPTAYDLQAASLEAIMSEFDRPDENFVTRLTHLLSGNGPNDPVMLNPDSVQRDGAANVLTSGTGASWFFSVGGVDLITPKGRKPGDVVTSL